MKSTARNPLSHEVLRTERTTKTLCLVHSRARVLPTLPHPITLRVFTEGPHPGGEFTGRREPDDTGLRHGLQCKNLGHSFGWGPTIQGQHAHRFAAAIVRATTDRQVGNIDAVLSEDLAHAANH